MRVFLDPYQQGKCTRTAKSAAPLCFLPPVICGVIPAYFNIIANPDLRCTLIVHTLNI